MCISLVTHENFLKLLFFSADPRHGSQIKLLGTQTCCQHGMHNRYGSRASKQPLWMLIYVMSLYAMAPKFALVNTRYDDGNNHMKLMLQSPKRHKRVSYHFKDDFMFDHSGLVELYPHAPRMCKGEHNDLGHEFPFLPKVGHFPLPPMCFFFQL